MKYMWTIYSINFEKQCILVVDIYVYKIERKRKKIIGKKKQYKENTID
jgi:hypothetical protein